MDDLKQYLGLPLWEKFGSILYITCVVVVYVYYMLCVVLLTCSISNCILLAETGLMEWICVYVYVCLYDWITIPFKSLRNMCRMFHRQVDEVREEGNWTENV